MSKIQQQNQKPPGVKVPLQPMEFKALICALQFHCTFAGKDIETVVSNKAILSPKEQTKPLLMPSLFHSKLFCTELNVIVILKKNTFHYYFF